MIVKRGEAPRNPMWELRGGKEIYRRHVFLIFFWCLEDVQKR